MIQEILCILFTIIVGMGYIYLILILFCCHYDLRSKRMRKLLHLLHLKGYMSCGFSQGMKIQVDWGVRGGSGEKQAGVG